MSLALGQILAGVPMGWNEAENALAKRRLEQQQYDTVMRQAPLQDDLLRAQAQHLRLAGTQAAQKRAEENAANMAYWRALTSPGGTAPSLPASPLGNAPQLPQAQQVQANPVAGFQGQTPFVGASMPQQSHAQPLQGLAPGGPQPGPIFGSFDAPQAPGQNPIQAAIQQRQQALQAIRSMPPTQANVLAGIRLDQEVRDLQQAEVMQRLKLDEELRRQQATSDLIRHRGVSESQGGQRLQETQRSHQEGERLRGEATQSREDQAITRFRVSQAENEIRSLSNQGLLRREDLPAIAQKWGVSPEQLAQPQAQNKDQSQVKNPFESTSLEDQNLFKAAVKTQVAAKGLTEQGFVMDFKGRRFRIYKGADGETHYDLEK